MEQIGTPEKDVVRAVVTKCLGMSQRKKILVAHDRNDLETIILP